MRYPTRKVTLTIHGHTREGSPWGMEIKAQQKRYGDHDWSSHVTVPKPAFQKILALGPEKVRVRCTGIYTDDYAYDNAANFQKGDVPLDAPLFTRPDYNVFSSDRFRAYATIGGAGQISFGRGQWEGYTLHPIDGEITLTVREG